MLPLSQKAYQGKSKTPQPSSKHILKLAWALTCGAESWEVVGGDLSAFPVLPEEAAHPTGTHAPQDVAEVDEPIGVEGLGVTIELPGMGALPPLYYCLRTRLRRGYTRMQALAQHATFVVAGLDTRRRSGIMDAAQVDAVPSEKPVERFLATEQDCAERLLQRERSMILSAFPLHRLRFTRVRTFRHSFSADWLEAATTFEPSSSGSRGMNHSDAKTTMIYPYVLSPCGPAVGTALDGR